MPSLRSMLHEYDLDFLNRIARSWNIGISQKDKESALADLIDHLITENAFNEKHASLSEKSHSATKELLSQGGEIPLEAFTRSHGQIRTFGPAKRAREEPDLNPVSTSELLWYSGLIGKAFLKHRGEVREVIFLPEEFLAFLRNQAGEAMTFSIRPAVNQSPRYFQQASSIILDQLTDLLAARRMNREVDPEIFRQWKVSEDFLFLLLRSCGLLEQTNDLDQSKLKDFLQAGRAQALTFLYKSWLSSTVLNDLRLLPGLEFEGKWANDPLLPRQLLVDILRGLNEGTWYSISSLVAEIHEKHPDFQRYAGEYESWFIRRKGEETYLSGFEHWDDVEGELLRNLLTGPLHWFGILDLASGPAGGDPAAFRITSIGSDLLNGQPLTTQLSENGLIELKEADGFVIPANTPLFLRYQAGRFARLVKVVNNSSWYRLTPGSLETAASQGINLRQLAQLLEKSQKKPLPKSFIRLVDRWEAHHLEAALKSCLLLRFTSAEACSLFLSQPRSAPMVLEQLNPLTLLLHPNSQEAAHRLLAEIGILAETEAVV